MSARKVFKKGVSMGFQPKRWIGLDHVASNGKICAKLLHDLIGKKKDSVEQSAPVEKLTAEELQSRKKLAILLMIFYSVVSIALVGYTGYLWFLKSLLLPGCMALIVSLLVAVYGLREFIIFGQIKFGRDRIGLSELVRLFFK